MSHSYGLGKKEQEGNGGGASIGKREEKKDKQRRRSPRHEAHERGRGLRDLDGITATSGMIGATPIGKCQIFQLGLSCPSMGP